MVVQIACHKHDESGIIMAMTAYQKIYDEAIGNYGLFFAAQARELGISGGALVNLARRGRLERLAHGVYRIDKYVPRPGGLDAYACAVACCGPDAYLWGPSAIEIRGLIPVDPSRMYVATPCRFRGKIPEGIVLERRAGRDEIGNFEGIRVQECCQAILASQHLVMMDRLLDAVTAATAQGLLDAAQAKATTRELYRND